MNKPKRCIITFVHLNPTVMRYLKYILIVTFTFLLNTGCSSDDENQNMRGGQVTPAVEAVEARFGALPLVERLSGIVSARNQIDIYPRISSPIEEVFVNNGDQVLEGDPLVRLRSREYNERLRQAEANLRISMAQQRQALATLNEAKSDLRREQVLAERDLSSQVEMERLKARVESAEANYELSQAQVEQAESNVAEQKEALDQTLVRAPISGTVGARNGEIGMRADGNSRLFVIGDLGSSKITVNLTERMLGYIRTGQTVRVYSENLADTVLTAQISRISPFLGSGNFSTEAEIDIDNQGLALMPGMFVTVDVLYGESEQATIVPLSALYRNPRTGETGVYVATSFQMEIELIDDMESSDDQMALSNPTDVEFISVEVIAKGREAVGISGVRSGQWVVTVGQNLLVNDRSGQARVRPVSWSRILDMQQLQPQDLLREVMEGNMAQRS